MTHLGLVSATGVCSAGFDVLCVDQSADLIGRLGRGELPVLEPDLDAMLASNGARQRFSSSFADLADRDVVYIAPDVPTDDAGTSDLSGIHSLIGEVTPHLNADALLVILCQVPPGFTRAVSFDPARLFYQVETLIFGRAVERATQPERYIVGCADPSKALPAGFAEVLGAFECPVLPMRYESAELAKISINMCLVSSVSVANTMAELCAEIGADWSEIVPALKLDKRIGAYSYLKPGLGIAGGNLERDLQTVLDYSAKTGTHSDIVRAWLENSAHNRDWAGQVLRKHLLGTVADPLVAVWGLAYKENTHSIKNSPSLATLSQFPETRFHVHDPAVAEEDFDHPSAKRFDEVMDTVSGADALMILTPWPEYRAQNLNQVAAQMRGTMLIDPYRIFEPRDVQAAGLVSHTMGVAPLET
ncbi:MAG: UDP-glucose/GDP-mannose dehydrogenase family protein [Rhizobiales bacterium]|nr:UDP-glucose/GDP-mannose dehydrogenase family protein [Hyphomicrobiales bacterium]